MLKAIATIALIVSLSLEISKLLFIPVCDFFIPLSEYVLEDILFRLKTKRSFLKCS